MSGIESSYGRAVTTIRILWVVILLQFIGSVGLGLTIALK